MIQGVIFDLGETLIRFEGTWSETIQSSQRALTDALEAEGIHLDQDAFHQEWHAEMQAAYQARDQDETERPSRELLANVLGRHGYPDVDGAAIDRSLKAMYKVSESLWRPIPEALSVLDALMIDYRLGMISNAGDAANVDRLIDKGGFRAYFDPILVSAALRYRKPSPKLFELMMDRWDLPAEDLVMVGDTLGADILGAQRVGMHQIWLATQADRDDNVEYAEAIHPEVTAASLAEVPDLVRHLDGADRATG
jgi:HAD superfamily hydrolase (TIGR01549 family)